MRFLYLTVGIMFLICFSAQANPLVQKENGALYVKSATTKEIADIFNEYKFFNFDKPRGKYPRIYMLKLPSDWQDVPDNNAKQKLFIKILLPLVLRVNEQILAERQKLEEINYSFQQDKKLSEEQLKTLNELAQKYDVFTRMSGDKRNSILLKKLLEKIDVVPPSVMISSAIIYTNWGMSRLARQANSLYLDEIWYEKQGLVPLDDDKADYRYKVYATLEECIAARALKINSHINYDYLREARKVARTMNKPPYGPQLASQMINDSNLPNIAGLIDYTFTFYQLANVDFYSQLEDVK